jgi:hypothetical protein
MLEVNVMVAFHMPSWPVRWLKGVFETSVARSFRLTALHVEELELVCVPAGTVSLTVAGGLLSIDGDRAANQLQVFRVNQSVTVTGLEGTQVSNQIQANGITQVSIHLGGNDLYFPRLPVAERLTGSG